MATEMVGGALLSASLQVLFEKMASPEVLNYLSGKKSSGLDVLLGKLKIKLSSVNAVLDDAEYKQIRNRGVKDWLDELQSAVFDAEDLLAEIEADGLQLKMEAESRTGQSKVSNWFCSIYSSTDQKRKPKMKTTDRERKAKIEEILGRLEYIVSEKDILGLKDLVVRNNSSWRLPSTSLVEESRVYGRGDDKDKLEDSLLKVKCLRVLSLSICSWIVSDSINELRHLRYLNLSCTSIERLPESLSKLYNLQTLKLTGCQYLEKLPKDFHHLINLRYLDVEFSGLVDMPTEMGKLKSLQKLSTFIVGKDEGTKIGELGELADLTGKLHIRNLQNVVKAEDASEAKLRDKKLEKLKLEWGHNYETEDTEHESAVLDNLLPNTTLKRLVISSYGGTKFPNWLGDQSFNNIVYVKLSDCKYFYILPPLGQLSSLKSLCIARCQSIVRVGPEFYRNSSSSGKPFPSLESLSFYSLSNWEEWLVPDEAFPMLTTLSMRNCKKLTGDLPCLLPHLTEITINACPQLASSLPMIPNVRKVALSGCEMITGYNLFESFGCLEDLDIWKSLDSTTCRSLPASLKRVTFSGCNNLEFPPLHSHNCPNLTELRISSVHKVMTSRMSWNLQGLPNLTKLSISCCTFENNLEPFPEEGLLPTTLTELTIIGLNWLKTVDSNGLQQLTSLTSLSVRYCISLQTITEPGLPSSLQKFELYECPLLEEKCERERGEYWNKIAHIPNIHAISAASSLRRLAPQGSVAKRAKIILSEIFWWLLSSMCRMEILYPGGLVPMANGDALVYGHHWGVPVFRKTTKEITWLLHRGMKDDPSGERLCFVVIPRIKGPFGVTFGDGIVEVGDGLSFGNMYLEDEDEEEEHVPSDVDHTSAGELASDGDEEDENEDEEVEAEEEDESWSSGEEGGSEGNEWSAAQIDGLFCPICFHPWTTDGDHYI
ncbi:hypothetical protein TIFTF001_008259 [Ficus carica]|uniref:Rx N-terminal domain-containing protein n=1 Tax=Ficus carica TaxID=3494 RepID=A0AA87ZRV2_FICCA|nr:hypothetical protein TIFTF001_008259 [Ficus carica]